MTVYTAKIKHSEDTIKAMAKAQYECFRSKSYYVLLIFAIVLLALTVFVSVIPQGVKTLMIAVGCFTVVGLASPPKQLAKQVINNLKGNFPSMEYRFGESPFSSRAQTPSCSNTKIFCIWHRTANICTFSSRTAPPICLSAAPPSLMRRDLKSWWQKRQALPGPAPAQCRSSARFAMKKPKQDSESEYYKSGYSLFT